MYPERSFQNQTGAGLPIAIFIITVLSLIVLGMSQLQESSGNAISLQIQSQRAFFAAESGAQAGMAKVLNADDPHNECPTEITTWSIDSFGGALAECEVNITCSSRDTPTIGGSSGDRIYSLSSKGQCGSGPDGAEREVEVRFR